MPTTNSTTTHQRATDALAAYIREQTDRATRCAVCGEKGDVTSAGRLLCAACAIVEKVWRTNDGR